MIDDDGLESTHTLLAWEDGMMEHPTTTQMQSLAINARTDTPDRVRCRVYVDVDVDICNQLQSCSLDRSLDG